MTAHFNAEYVVFAKAGIKAIVDPWIDSLVVGNRKFLVNGVTTVSLGIGGVDPTNRTKATFKAKLLYVIDKAAIAVPVATSGNHKALKTTRNAVNQAVADAVLAWLTSIGGDDGAVFLNNNPVVLACNPVADRIKRTFKTAVENLIKTF